MTSCRTCMIGLIWAAAFAGLPACAQNQDEYDDPQAAELDPESVEDVDSDSDATEDRELDRKRKRRADRAVRTVNLDRLETLMKREIHLDEDQLEAIEELFEDRRAEYRVELEESRESAQGQTSTDQMRDMLLRMREARDARDQETMREITESIRGMHLAHRVEQVSDDFATEIEELLDEDQIEKFRRFLAKGRPGAEREASLRKNPPMLRRYVMRLQPTDQQREGLQELYGELREEYRTGDLTLAEREEIAGEFHDDVMELLDEDQKTRLKKYIGKDDRRSFPTSSRRLRRTAAERDRQEVEANQDYDDEDSDEEQDDEDADEEQDDEESEEELDDEDD